MTRTANIDAEEPRPWDKLPEESAAAFQAFRAYLEQGLGRTISAAWERYREERGLEGSQVSRHLTSWRVEHDWDDRCDAFDASVLGSTEELIRQQRMALVKRLNDASSTVLETAIRLAIGNEEQPPDGTMVRFLLGTVLPQQKPTLGTTNIRAENVQINQQMIDKLSTDDIKRLIRETTKP